MKKIICLTLASLMLLTLASCGKNEEKTAETTTDTVSETENETATETVGENVQVVNPLQDVTAEEAVSALGLKNIILPDGCTAGDITKINGTPESYRFSVTKDEVEYKVTVAKSDGSMNGDISGIYLSDDAVCAIFDSADVSVQPSYSVEYDSEYIKAYCEWNSFYFAIDAETSAVDSEEFAAFAVSVVKALLCNGNLA